MVTLPGSCWCILKNFRMDFGDMPAIEDLSCDVIPALIRAADLALALSRDRAARPSGAGRRPVAPAGPDPAWVMVSTSRRTRLVPRMTAPVPRR